MHWPALPLKPGIARAVGLALLPALLAPAASAAEPVDAPQFEWGGYGTLSAYRADVQGARIRPDRQNAHTATEGGWRADADSRLGLQGRLRLPGATEAVVQVVSSDAADKPYKPRVEWAYLNWSASESVNLRLGRQTLPFLRHSETRNVGFAQTGVRPNAAVYSLNPGVPVDGANLSWEHGTEQGTWRLDLGAGRASAVYSGVRFDVRRSVTAALNWQSGPWTARVGASDFSVDFRGTSVASPALLALCENCGSVLAARAPTQGLRGRLYSALFVWDSQPWEFVVEAVWRPDSNSVLVPRGRGAYAQLSRRFGEWRVHGATGRQSFREPPLGLQARPEAPPTAATAIGLLDRYLQTPNDLATLQAGVGVDLNPRLVLKLQHERWRALRDRSTGRNGLVLLTTPPLGNAPATWNGRAKLTTVSLDFVF